MSLKYLLKVMLLYVKDHIKSIIKYIIFSAIYVTIFFLYSIDIEPIVYAFLLVSCLGIIFSFYDFIKYYKKYSDLYNIKNQISVDLEKVPIANGTIEAYYQNILFELYNQKQEIALKSDIKQTEMIDYYTLWAHQIKTPIAAMKLLLQFEQNKQNKELLTELFKIDQYVDMVLGYLRIESSSSDLVFQNYDLSKIIRQAIRKYAHIFIKKGIAVEFNEMNCSVLSDEKWLVFVIEQILSNSLKYTKKGKISIYMDSLEEKTLVIEDTGIGIEQEDLPRIFEKGFTGYNGRMDKKATGIGLYLCKKILNKLSHSITITSIVDEGTTVKINLSSIKIIME
ncbi:MAG: sensor histidine kinase [Clostridium sp.]|uniref:sensor histidine kinase n=1 Tax=Clostridium sp. TaxID=1506 RepID=UPI0030725B8A